MWQTIALSILGVGTAAQIAQGEESRRQSRKANLIQQRIEAVKAQRERVRLIAEARRKRAALAAQAEMTGVSGSSGAIGGQQQLVGQAASGLSFLDTTARLSSQRNIFLQRSADASSRAAAFGALGQLGFKASGLWGSDKPETT